MPTYRVQFSKNLVNSNGLPFKCSQRTINVSGEPTPDKAICEAWRQYDRDTNGLAHQFADLAEAQLVEADFLSKRVV